MRTTANSVNRLSRHRKTPSGYADVQSDYMAAGWIPLPLPRGQKYPPPRGYTGERAGIPDYKKYCVMGRVHSPMATSRCRCPRM